jgi:hypothetical protein
MREIKSATWNRGRVAYALVKDFTTKTPRTQRSTTIYPNVAITGAWSLVPVSRRTTLDVAVRARRLLAKM